MTPQLYDRVRFAPNPRFPDKTVDAIVMGFRRRANDNTGTGAGWAETRDDAGKDRSVALSRCTVLERRGHP